MDSVTMSCVHYFRKQGLLVARSPFQFHQDERGLRFFRIVTNILIAIHESIPY